MMKFLSTFLTEAVGHVFVAFYALFGWLLVFTPKARDKMGLWLQEIFGKEKFELMLYQSGISFAHGEPALACWWMALKLESLLFAVSAVTWAVLFKLVHMPGPVWLVAGWFSLKGVLAVEFAARALFITASSLTTPIDPATMPKDNNDDKSD